MILDQETISYIIGITVLANVGLTVYNSLRKPQEKGEITDAVMEEKFTQLDRELANLRDNHIHTVTTDLRNHIVESQGTALASAEKLGRIEGKLDMLISKK